jgi:hypothetical protein
MASGELASCCFEQQTKLRLAPVTTLILSGFDPKGGTMNQDVFNMSVRKFLKEFGITAQRESENTVREALSKGSLTGKKKLPVKITLTLGQTSLHFEIEFE